MLLRSGLFRNAHTVILSLDGDDWTIESIVQLPEGVQPQISVHELGAAEGVVRKDPRVIKLAAEVGASACDYSQPSL